MNDNLVALVEQESKQIERKRVILEKIGQGIRGDELMKKAFPPRRWVVDGVLPQGELAVLSGKKGSGKTLLALNLVQSISSGLDFIGLKTNPTKALFISLEMGPRTIQTRLGESRIPWSPEKVQFHWSWPRLPEGAEALESFIGAHSIGLTFVDVIAKIRSRGSDWSDYGSAYEQFGPLREIAQRTDSSIVLLTHERKRKEGEDPTERILGSIGLSGNAGVLLSLMRMIHQGTGALEISGNDIQHQIIPIELKTDPLLFVRSDVSYTELGQPPERRAILAAIRELGGKATPSQIADYLGKERSNINHQIRKMTESGDVVSVAYGQYSLCTPIHFDHSIHSEGQEPKERVNAVNRVNTFPSESEKELEIF